MDKFVEYLLKYGPDCQVVLSVGLAVFGVLTAFVPLNGHRAKLTIFICGQGMVLIVISIALLQPNADWLAHVALQGTKITPNERLQAMLVADDEAHKQAVYELVEKEREAALEIERYANNETIEEKKLERQASIQQRRKIKIAELERRKEDFEQQQKEKQEENERQRKQKEEDLARDRASKNLVGAWIVDSRTDIQRETIRFDDDGSCTAYFWDGNPPKRGRYFVKSPQLVLVQWTGEEIVKFPSDLMGTTRYIEVADHNNLPAYKEQD